MSENLAEKLALMLREDFKGAWCFETKQLLRYGPIIDEILGED